MKSDMTYFWSWCGIGIFVLCLCLGMGGCSYLLNKGHSLNTQTEQTTNE